MIRVGEDPPIRLRLDGQRGLIHGLDSLTARILFARLKLTRHERSLFHFEPYQEPPMPQQLSFRRDGYGALPRLHRDDLHRMESLVSDRVLSGAWLLGRDEGKLQRGTVPGRRPGSTRGCAFVTLYGMIFEVEPLRLSTLLAGPPRDVLAQALHPAFALLRFEGVVSDGQGLALSLRDRTDLDRAWTQPLDGRSPDEVMRWTFDGNGKKGRDRVGRSISDGRSEGRTRGDRAWARPLEGRGENRVLRWFAVRSVQPQPGFSLVAPSLLGPRGAWARDTQPQPRCARRPDVLLPGEKSVDEEQSSRPPRGSAPS